MTIEEKTRALLQADSECLSHYNELLLELARLKTHTISYIKLNKAAKQINVELKTLREQIKQGKLSYVSKDGALWVEKKSLEAIQASLPRAPEMGLDYLTELTQDMGLYD